MTDAQRLAALYDMHKDAFKTGVKGRVSEFEQTEEYKFWMRQGGVTLVTYCAAMMILRQKDRVTMIKAKNQKWKNVGYRVLSNINAELEKMNMLPIPNCFEWYYQSKLGDKPKSLIFRGPLFDAMKDLANTSWCKDQGICAKIVGSAMKSHDEQYSFEDEESADADYEQEDSPLSPSSSEDASEEESSEEESSVDKVSLPQHRRCWTSFSPSPELEGELEAIAASFDASSPDVVSTVPKSGGGGRAPMRMVISPLEMSPLQGGESVGGAPAPRAAAARSVVGALEDSRVQLFPSGDDKAEDASGRYNRFVKPPVPAIFEVDAPEHDVDPLPADIVELLLKCPIFAKHVGTYGKDGEDQLGPTIQVAYRLMEDLERKVFDGCLHALKCYARQKDAVFGGELLASLSDAIEDCPTLQKIIAKGSFALGQVLSEPGAGGEIVVPELPEGQDADAANLECANFALEVAGRIEEILFAMLYRTMFDVIAFDVPELESELAAVKSELAAVKSELVRAKSELARAKAARAPAKAAAKKRPRRDGPGDPTPAAAKALRRSPRRAQSESAASTPSHSM